MTDTMPSTTGREPRPEKVAIVDEVKERLQRSSAALLTEYRGLRVSELSALRAALTSAGGDLKVYKNTLVRFAVRDLELDLDEAMLTGPTAIAFVDGDAAAVAKALRDFARTNPNLVVKGGILGDAALSADEARALADLPSRDVLLARLAGGLAAPLVGFAGLLQALPRNLAYGLKALIDQGGAPGAPAAAVVADESAADESAADESATAPPSDDSAADESAAAPPSDEGGPAETTAEAAMTADVAPATDAPSAVPVEGAPAGATTEAAPAAEGETEAAPAAATDTEGEATPAETTDTPEEAS